MANATRNHGLAACGSAIRNTTQMPPHARLWLARASLFTDPKGRTGYGPARYANDMGDTEHNGQAAINWLTHHGLVLNDVNDDGVECWRLAHYDWDSEDTIGGYSRDAGQKRDGLPPQYGRTVADVIAPNGKRYQPPSETDWRQLVTEEPPA